MERQDAAIVALQRELQCNPNVGRQGRQIRVKEEYDDDVEEEDENEADRMSFDHKRNRPHEEGIKGIWCKIFEEKELMGIFFDKLTFF